MPGSALGNNSDRMQSLHLRIAPRVLHFINPRRACAARVTVVVLCVVCVCVCVQAAHLRLTQLSDKLDILTDLVSWWLQNKFGVFRIMALFRR